MSINSSTKFYEVKSVIFNSHCDFFIHSNEGEDAKKSIKEKLKKAFKDYKSDLKAESFIYTDNKNPAPKIIENILKRFGVKFLLLPQRQIAHQHFHE